MEIIEYKQKMICVCCKKVIPKSKIFMISKETEDGEMVLKHMCSHCHKYAEAIKNQITVSDDVDILQCNIC